MKYIVAVSGGVDSVVLLDIMRKAPQHEIIVAHFDHGIREDSARDAQFVQALARKHGYHFETLREELGETASEALARERRYAFLRALAKKHDARIITAHHLDDLVETVTINLQRGTGWRGLAALDSDIVRPLIDMPKEDIIAYAKGNKLIWREDSTNASDAYLRNRIRRKASLIPHDHKRQLRALHSHQKVLKREIEDESRQLIGDGPEYSRYFFTNAPKQVSLECLRVITKGKLTRPQLVRSLLAIKTAAAGSNYEAGSGVNIHFGTRHFSL